MNNTLDPFIHRMRNAEDDAARALALLEAPVFTLMRLREEFRRLCRRAAFDDGEAYLDALAEALSSPRHLGVIPDSGAQRIRLVYAAEGGRR